MTVNIQTSTVRKADLNTAQIEAFLAIAVGFDPKKTKIRYSGLDKSDIRFELSEETSGFAAAVEATFKQDPDKEPLFIDTLMMQLKEWDASPMNGNAVAARAWRLIEYYQRQLAKVSVGGAPISTGVNDKNGTELFLGDIVRNNNESSNTKKEYWYPEYKIVWEPPSFTLEHIGGGLPGDNRAFLLRNGGGNGNLELIARPKGAHSIPDGVKAI